MMAREERLFELLASRATEGLTPDDADRLDDLLIEFPSVQPQEFERAAAGMHLALLGPERPMPADVKRRLSAAVERHAATDAELPVDPGSESPRSSSAPRTSSRFGWWAAAAALALALLGWWPRFQPAPDVVETAPSAATATETALAEDPSTLRLAWTATDDTTATGASGEVVWNNDRQTGYMRFTGLEVNDPAVHQYQLWIFDRARDERYPVDGGVFDMTAEGGEVVVPIDARLPVDEPYLFAVTVEPPGGVVVSTRERIALVAQS